MMPPRRLAALLICTAPLALSQSRPRPARPAPPTQSNAFDRLRAMPPLERRKALEKLPPDRRRQAEERLAQLDRMSPSERDELARRYHSFQRLPPASQAQARRMFREFSQLPQDRHSKVREAFDRLHEMSSSERAAFLRSPEVQSRYNRTERSILEDYVSLIEAPLR